MTQPATNDVRQRLAKCFGGVFPDLDEREILTATATSVPAWDSVATITLMTVIEEEFSVSVNPVDLDRFLSFDSVLDYLKTEKSVS